MGRRKIVHDLPPGVSARGAKAVPAGMFSHEGFGTTLAHSSTSGPHSVNVATSHAESARS